MSSRGLPKTRQIRERLRKEAGLRQVEYDKLTLQQKLDRLPPAPHAKKQRAKLLAQLQKPVKLVEEATVNAAEKAAAEELLGQEPKRLKAKERRAKEKKG